MIKTLIICALAASTLATKCKIDGHQYKNGDTWIDARSQFKMKCTTGPGYWDAMPIACVTPSGHEVWPHDLRIEDGKLYKCEEAGYGMLESTWRIL